MFPYLCRMQEQKNVSPFPLQWRRQSFNNLIIDEGILWLEWIDWLTKCSDFTFWALWSWNRFPGNVFFNSCNRHLQFVSGTWSGDSDLAFVRQSPGKEHPQSSGETDSVSQAISLNKSCWMNAFVPHSLPLIVCYCKGVTVNESSHCILSFCIDWCRAVD